MDEQGDVRGAELRAFYAKLITAMTATNNDRVVSAFSAVPRERFSGPGPWKIAIPSGYLETPSNDLAYLYQNVLVAISPDETINNGEPAAHARWLAALDVKEGEKVLQVGTGAGYYTAILAHLVGPSGQVLAYEIDQVRAAMSAANLAAIPTVRVLHRSGTDGPLPAVDAIYVNAGATHPVDAWLDALTPKGRLLFPLTGSEHFEPDRGRWAVTGGMLLVHKTEQGDFAARFISPAGFIGCIGAREDATTEALSAAFRRGDFWNVQSLRRGTMPDNTCWYAGSGWWLSTAPPPAD